MRVKDIAILAFAKAAQKLLVTYTSNVLKQSHAANGYERHWIGEHGQYCLAHVKYVGSNNNMGIEVDWRDMKGECLPSANLGTFTGSLVCLIEHLWQEHQAFIAKHVANLFPGKQYLTKRIFDKLPSVHYRTLTVSFFDHH